MRTISTDPYDDRDDRDDERQPWLGLGGAALGLAVVIGVIAAAGWLAARFAGRLEPLLSGLGPWGPPAYVSVAIVATLVLVPGSVTKLAAGALFGLGPGIVWGWIAAALGSIAPFWLARLGRERWFERRLERFPRLARFDESLRGDGRKLVVLLRLSPLVPYNVLNYGLGAGPVRFADYLWGIVGMAPSIVLYVYAGYVARALAMGSERQRGWWEWALIALGLGATLVASWVVARHARAALSPSSNASEALDGASSSAG